MEIGVFHIQAQTPRTAELGEGWEEEKHLDGEGPSQ